MTVSGLPAGTYLWTSLHLDAQDRYEPFNASITSASGTSDVVNIAPQSGNLGANLYSEVAKYQQVFTSNGSDPVTILFDSISAFFYMNAFMVTNTDLPVGELAITEFSFDVVTGDFLINFLPGGSGYILTSSDDLFSPFMPESSATLENDNKTFRVPAANLNPGKDFFRVETAP